MRTVNDSQLTLGELISALGRYEEDAPAKPVYFDFVHFQPDGVHSYRGYYDQLALGYKVYPVGEDCTVGGLLAELRASVGKTFEGYKGGDYVMTNRTPLWVAEPNESGGTGIVGVRDGRWRVLLETKSID